MNKFVFATLSTFALTLSAATLAYSVVKAPIVPARPAGAIVNKSAQSFKPLEPLPKNGMRPMPTPVPPPINPMRIMDRTEPKKLNNVMGKCDKMQSPHCKP